ncbi:hypothetical protein BLA60_29830 [Actinophytocola xinjiangensis]|uniref:Protein kinase domain-containing protein n=1 Tax=Actinophytocola xinjiangensis TaxID=485602 RepID=A0A7Z0WHD2_9PSEU|nr:WD40 repeat domain-containing serine/threonine protein kinase [Actinophytocola xinjiangensis]OLF06761.1 hypothetical protein BLA60_29830 [Actinophytocola xinjiangensis]
MKALRTAATSTVGPYGVVAELGQGGMGRVLLGSAPDGRLVAVKLVHEPLADDDGFRARFRREVAASKAVSGAYTAAVVDADPDAPTPWLASVFVPGPSLHEALTTVGALPEPAVLRLAAGLASALTHIHRAGLVHRDLKPSNVLLTDDGPRVIDFGIVRAVSESDELTRTGWLVGSPAFMSPEQADGGAVGPAGDVFALGSVVVAAATGASPFVGATTLHTLTNIVRHDPRLAGVPDAVRRIVEPCLAKDPADRPTPAAVLASIGQIAPAVRPWPQDVHQLIVRRQAEVGEFLEPGRDATVLVTGPPPRSTRVEARARRPRRWIAAAALVVVLALAGALVWSVWPSERPARPAPSQQAPVIERIGTDMTGTSPVTSLMVSPDGAVITARFEDRTVQSWDSATQDQIGQILGSFSGDGVRHAVFAPDNRTLVTARVEGEDEDQRIVVEHWDLTTGRQPVGPFSPDLTGEDRFYGNVWPMLSPDGRVLAVSSDYDRQIRLWDVNARRSLGGVEERSAWGFSPDSRTLITSGLAGWDVATRRKIAEGISLPDDEQLRSYVYTDDGATQLTVSPDRSTDAEDAVVRWWDTASRNQLRQPLTIATSAERIALSPDGRRLATVDAMTGATVWDLDTGNRIGEKIPGVTAVAFTPNGILVTGNNDNAIQLWRLPAG